MAFVFIDEHPDSIGRGYEAFWFDYLPTLVHWRLLPANYHSGGTTMCFADGHGEYKKWMVPETRQPVKYTAWAYPEHPEIISAGRQDYEWLARRFLEADFFQ